MNSEVYAISAWAFEMLRVWVAWVVGAMADRAQDPISGPRWRRSARALEQDRCGRLRPGLEERISSRSSFGRAMIRSLAAVRREIGRARRGELEPFVADAAVIGA
jgi:hypothetical protein